MITVASCNDQNTWDDYVQNNNGHPLQLWGWGTVKSAHGWHADRVFVSKKGQVIGAAQILVKPLPILFRALAYIPRGPVASPGNREVVLEELAAYVKRTYHPVSLSIEPDWTIMPSIKGWRRSSNTILIPRTIILDLERTEESLQTVMTKKTRQYVRKSAADGVTVRKVSTIDEVMSCLAIYKQTAKRAGFALHRENYYTDIFNELGDASPVFIAEYENQIVAFLWPLMTQEIAFELYGGMNEIGQHVRANYTLKWEVIRYMKAHRVKRYDMNGLLNDGVSTFKQSFAGHEDMLVGTYDRPLSLPYGTWTKGLPVAKKVIRKLKNH